MIPIGVEFFSSISFLSEFVQFGQDGRRKHIFDVDTAGSLGVEEEEELPDHSDDVEFHI